MKLNEKKAAVDRLFAYLKANVPSFADADPRMVRNRTSTGERLVTNRTASKYEWFLKARNDNGGWTYFPGGKTREQVYDKLLEQRRRGKGFFCMHSSPKSWDSLCADPYYPVMEKIRKPESTEELLIVLTAAGF